MDQSPSHGDIFRWALGVIVIGAAAAVGVGAVLAVGSFLLIEPSCTGEYMCGLGAAVWAGMIAAAGGTAVFTAASAKAICWLAPVGSRVRVAAMAYLGIPAALAAILALAGLAS